MLISIDRQLLPILIDCSRQAVGHFSANSARPTGVPSTFMRRMQRPLLPTWWRAAFQPRGLRQKVEAFNICDQECGTYRDLLATAYKATGDPRYKIRIDIPFILDLAKNVLKYHNIVLRYPLGMLIFSNAKLLATGFKFPTGFKSALSSALGAQLT